MLRVETGTERLVRATLEHRVVTFVYQGLRRTVEWYIENEGWWRRVLSGAYRGERLGLRLV